MLRRFSESTMFKLNFHFAMRSHTKLEVSKKINNGTVEQ